MNLLLDTHIWLWSLLEPVRLRPKVVAALTAKGAERWLSPLSIWEALLLIERKRVEVDRPGEAWIREARVLSWSKRRRVFDPVGSVCFGYSVQLRITLSWFGIEPRSR